MRGEEHISLSIYNIVIIEVIIIAEVIVVNSVIIVIIVANIRVAMLISDLFRVSNGILMMMMMMTMMLILMNLIWTFYIIQSLSAKNLILDIVIIMG